MKAHNFCDPQLLQINRTYQPRTLWIRAWQNSKSTFR